MSAKTGQPPQKIREKPPVYPAGRHAKIDAERVAVVLKRGQAGPTARVITIQRDHPGPGGAARQAPPLARQQGRETAAEIAGADD